MKRITGTQHRNSKIQKENEEFFGVARGEKCKQLTLLPRMFGA